MSMPHLREEYFELRISKIYFPLKIFYLLVLIQIIASRYFLVLFLCVLKNADNFLKKWHLDKCRLYLDKIPDMKKRQVNKTKHESHIEEDKISFVNEEATSYYQSHQSIAYSSNWESFFSVTQKGVVAGEVTKVVLLGPFRADFYCDALDISTKTLDRYIADNRRLNPNDSELVLKWKALYMQGKETFDSLESFGNWLQKSAYGLNGIVPKEMMKTSRGIDIVMQELIRIEWGQIA